MSLICKFCKSVMEEVESYNPPYPEPKETIYKCFNCGASASDNEAYGIEWEKGEIYGLNLYL